ncbi:MAG: hypothetical protein KC766_18150 [Myxococcales bacterium]|nr:hypothetical protein [Myxococcales bacterium]
MLDSVGPNYGIRWAVAALVLGLSLGVSAVAHADAEPPNACSEPGKPCVYKGEVGTCVTEHVHDRRRERWYTQTVCEKEAPKRPADDAWSAATKRRIAQGVLVGGVLFWVVAGIALWRKFRRPEHGSPPDAQ